MVALLKKIVPRSVKQRLKSIERERRLGAAVRRLAALKEGEVPPRELLAELGRGWGDDGFRAVGGYIEEVARRAAETRGPILEIGSGLTTIMLGHLAARRGVAVWTLEHHPQFFQQTEGRLKRYGADGDRKSTRLNSSHSQISYA